MEPHLQQEGPQLDLRKNFLLGGGRGPESSGRGLGGADRSWSPARPAFGLLALRTVVPSADPPPLWTLVPSWDTCFILFTSVTSCRCSEFTLPAQLTRHLGFPGRGFGLEGRPDSSPRGIRGGGTAWPPWVPRGCGCLGAFQGLKSITKSRGGGEGPPGPLPFLTPSGSRSPEPEVSAAAASGRKGEP